jgi:hypothetical protein
MSMWLSFVRVSPATFKKLKATPDLLECVFFGEGKKDKKKLEELGIDQDKHSAGVDYLLLSEAFEAIAERESEEDGDEGEASEEDDSGDDDSDAVIADLGPTGALEYDAGYDEAFFLAPAAVKRAVEESNVADFDKDVKALFKAAAKDGHYVIGIVS